MSRPRTVGLPDDLALWVDEHVGPGQLYPNRNQLIIEAVRRFKEEFEGIPALDFDFETEPEPIAESKAKELKSAIGAHLVIDCLPPIPPGDKPKAVHVSIPEIDHRLMSIMLSDLPGLPQKTITDLARSLIHVALRALDEVRQINHPTWRAFYSLLDASYQREGRHIQEKGLADKSGILYEDLVELANQDRWAEAYESLVTYYNDIHSLPTYLRSAGIRVLERLPIAQHVAYMYREMLPDGYPRPETPPNFMALRDKTGLYVAPDHLALPAPKK